MISSDRVANLVVLFFFFKLGLCGHRGCGSHPRLPFTCLDSLRTLRTPLITNKDGKVEANSRSQVIVSYFDHFCRISCPKKSSRHCSHQLRWPTRLTLQGIHHMMWDAMPVPCWTRCNCGVSRCKDVAVLYLPITFRLGGLRICRVNFLWADRFTHEHTQIYIYIHNIHIIFAYIQKRSSTGNKF